ncbi:uncharacterized protein L3040_000675 [Drepanopeziza brunnea f. sp. 'multigermtubi']|uniref:uncharacterized protein n=1 Tax=Drepanopeziza brunnea f. sp. 'multigermtubi' TaxID=698441 RepID=UPI00238EA534|nr:hypothetical protein L3040_000675 [Drepanopeziza brunnea f. sp. 'multigermtubi']
MFVFKQAATSVIKEQHPYAEIVATDESPYMIQSLEARKFANGWTDVETSITDVHSLYGFKDNTFSHVFTSLALSPVAEQANIAIKEVLRVLKPGGVAFFSTWGDYRVQAAFYDASLIVRPTEEPNVSFSLLTEWTQEAWLTTQLEIGGFEKDSIIVNYCTTSWAAPTANKLIDNMMIYKREQQPAFFAGYSKEEANKFNYCLRRQLEWLKKIDESDQHYLRTGAWIGRCRKGTKAPEL